MPLRRFSPVSFFGAFYFDAMRAPECIGRVSKKMLDLWGKMS